MNRGVAGIGTKIVQAKSARGEQRWLNLARSYEFTEKGVEVHFRKQQNK
jgi:hypothetical protein